MLFLSKEFDWSTIGEEPLCTVQAIAQGLARKFGLRSLSRLAENGAQRLRWPISRLRPVTVFQDLEDCCQQGQRSARIIPLFLLLFQAILCALDRSRG